MSLTEIASESRYINGKLRHAIKQNTELNPTFHSHRTKDRLVLFSSEWLEHEAPLCLSVLKLGNFSVPVECIT